MDSGASGGLERFHRPALIEGRLAQFEDQCGFAEWLQVGVVDRRREGQRVARGPKPSRTAMVGEDTAAESGYATTIL